MAIPIPDILRSWTNPDLWKELICDGDGWWIRDALLDGTLYLSSDGLWQKEIDPSVCSCAFIVKCTESKQELKCTWVEKVESASNYRAELLGAIGNLLDMKAVLPDIRTTDCDVTTEATIGKTSTSESPRPYEIPTTYTSGKDIIHSCIWS